MRNWNNSKFATYNVNALECQKLYKRLHSVCKRLHSMCTLRVYIQGAPKEMYHSDLYPISVLEVGFYFFTYVLESEF